MVHWVGEASCLSSLSGLFFHPSPSIHHSMSLMAGCALVNLYMLQKIWSDAISADNSDVLTSDLMFSEKFQMLDVLVKNIMLIGLLFLLTHCSHVRIKINYIHSIEVF